MIISGLDVREHDDFTVDAPKGRTRRHIRALDPYAFTPEKLVEYAKAEAAQRGWTLDANAYGGRGWEGVLDFLRKTYYTGAVYATAKGTWGVINFACGEA
jgi:hypothetical protein